MTPKGPNEARNDVGYGARTFDLATKRTDKLIALPLVTSVTVLKAESSVQARFGDDSNADVELQDLNTITFDNPIDQLYLTNASGTGDLEILVGRKGINADANVPDEVDVTDRSNRDLGTVDVSDRSGREVGKVRVEDSSGTLIDPATTALEDALQSTAAADQDPFLVQEDTALDVSAATVPTEQQTPIALEDDGGTAISTSNPLSVDAPNTLTVTDDGSFNVAGTVSVQEASALDVSAATVSVQEASALDVSAAEVTTANATLASVTHGQDTVSTPGTSVNLNGGTSITIPDGATLTIRAEIAASDDMIYVGDSTVTSSNGFQLEDGEGVSLAVDDVTDVHIDADTANDGVSWIVEQ